jgi:hypothetical protein
MEVHYSELLEELLTESTLDDFEQYHRMCSMKKTKTKVVMGRTEEREEVEVEIEIEDSGEESGNGQIQQHF